MLICLKFHQQWILYIFLFWSIWWAKTVVLVRLKYCMLPAQLYFLLSELPIHFHFLFFFLQLPHFDLRVYILSTWLCASHCTRCFPIIFFLETTHFTDEKYEKHEEEIQTLVFFTGLFYSKGCMFCTISLYQKASFYWNIETPKGSNLPKHSQSCSLDDHLNSDHWWAFFWSSWKIKLKTAKRLFKQTY